jgi:hypothetical protein
MANKHSRQGLALGLATVLGSTGLVATAPAAAAQTLDLEIASQVSNGVLATTWDNDFQLTLDWGSQTNGLENLHYDISIASSDEDSDAYADVSISAVSWDAEEDRAFSSAATRVDETVNTFFSNADEKTAFAPAASYGEDNTQAYLVTVAGGEDYWSGEYLDTDADTVPINYQYYFDEDNGWTRSSSGGDIEGSIPFNDATDNDGDAIDGPEYTVTYTAIPGEYSGTIPNITPSGFDSLITIAKTSSEGDGPDTTGDYFDVTVKGFIDTNDNNILDNGETYSNELTVRFWNPDALTPVLTLADEGKVWYEDIGSTESLVTETYISQELNEVYTTVLTDVRDNFTVVNILDYQYERDGHVLLTSVGASYKAALTGLNFDFSADPEYDGKHLFESKTITADPSKINRASVVDADQTDVDNFFSEPNTVEKIVSGPLAVSFLPQTVTDVTGEVVEATLVYASGEDAYIRSDVESVTYVFSLVNEDDLDEDLNPAPVAGASVTISGVYNDSLEGELTINGVSVVDAEDADGVNVPFEVTGTANAAGEVVLEVTSSNPHADLYVFFGTVTTQGEDFGVSSDLYWDDSDWNLVDELNSEDSASGYNSLRTVGVGESTTIKYDVRDQWYQMPDNGTAQITFYVEDSSSASRSFDGHYRGPVSVVNGAASITIPDSDPESVEGTFVILAELDVREEDGSWDSDVDEDSTEIEYVNDATVALIQQDEDAASDGIAYNDFMTVNRELVRWTEAMADTYDLQDEHDYIDGYVRNADGLGLAGVRVTATGAGLQFMDDSWQFYGEGSLTLFTDEDGYYHFDIQGHTVGEHTVTITAGGKSATATYEVTDGNVRAHNVAITSPFAAKAGTADTLTALVTDRYGNTMTAGETVTFSKVAGSGYIQETNGTVTTDEDGVATATLIIMSGEVGFNSTVRAAITQDDFAATSNSAAAQRSAGDTNVGKTTAWTKLQADGTAKMYAKNIVGAGKVQFFHNNKEIAWVRAADALNPKLRAANGAFYLVRTVELVDGKNVLEVYIDGERVRRTAYSK